MPVKGMRPAAGTAFASRPAAGLYGRNNGSKSRGGRQSHPARLSDPSRRALLSGADYHQLVQTQTKLGDILANAITHGIGAVLAVVGAVYLIAASARGTAWQIASCTIFASTLVLVYVCSTLYHSLVRTRARHVFR